MWTAITRVEQLVAGFLPPLFLAIYLFRVRPARRTLERLYLIGSNVVFTAVLGLGFVTALFGQSWPGRDVIRAVAYALVIAVFAAQIYLLFAALRPSRKDNG